MLREYFIDLDDTESYASYRKLISDYRHEIKKILELKELRGVRKFLRATDTREDWWGMGARIAKGLTNRFLKLGVTEHGKFSEMAAGVLGITPLEVYALQMYYELHAGCTSVVVKDENDKGGRILHGRTMDWNMPELLPVTVPVLCRVNGEVVGKSVIWAGMFGFFTIMCAKKFAISVNFRQAPQEYGKMYNAVYSATGDVLTARIAEKILRLGKQGYSVPHLLHEAALRGGDYLTTRAFLFKAKLLSSTYLTLSGPYDAIVIPRYADPNDTSMIEARTMARNHSQRYVVVANMDWWYEDATDVEESRVRAQSVAEYLDDRVNCNQVGLWGILRHAPVCNINTIYGVVMIPSSDEKPPYEHSFEINKNTCEKKTLKKDEVEFQGRNTGPLSEYYALDYALERWSIQHLRAEIRRLGITMKAPNKTKMVKAIIEANERRHQEEAEAEKKREKKAAARKRRKENEPSEEDGEDEEFSEEDGEDEEFSEEDGVDEESSEEG